jgi:hypothetical protein
VIVVGRPVGFSLGHCALAARIEIEGGVENDEDGTPVFKCPGPDGSWSELWPKLERLG